MACPHTMKATDRDGTVYCCDCGKVILRSPFDAAQDRFLPSKRKSRSASVTRVPADPSALPCDAGETDRG